MKKDTLQKKRRPAQKKKGLTLLYSKTRKKKQRVSASSAADLGSEVPNLGVARALFIILLLHVAAIVAIIVHSRMTSDEPVALKNEPVPTVGAAVASAVQRAPAAPLPQVQQGEDYYFVATGDSYERVAQLKGVDVQALRALNDNVPMQAGRILRIPTPGVSTMAATPVEINTSRPEEPEVVEPLAAVDAPAEAVPVAVAPAEERAEVSHRPAARAVIVEAEAEPKVQAIKVRPQVKPPVASASSSGQKYTVKSGDTVWSISKRFSVNREELLKVNGVSDPRKLRIGMTLVIPSS